jgi:hypothetical protein
MAWLKLRGASGLLFGVLATACLGGQTGQPGSATSCDNHQLSSSAEWGDTTVAAAAATFAGTYDAPLLWQQVAADFQDRLQLSIFYDGGGARRGCDGRLAVPVTVTLSTSESDITESGDATLEIAVSSGGLVGDLSYAGERVALDARLTEVAAGVSLVGDFASLDEELPGASAGFAMEP